MKIPSLDRRETCTLCDDTIIAGHGVCIGGRGDRVVCCPDCYAIFSDLRAALRVTPLQFDGSIARAEKGNARKLRARRGEPSFSS